MNNRNLLIASTSTVYGKPYLEYLVDEIKEFFLSSNQIVFIPYARPGGITFDEYTIIAKKFFEANGMSLTGIHEFEDPKKALENCDGVFTGGGNTFVLQKTLYDNGLIQVIRERLSEGLPYMGTSAGSNILGATIRTTNDMPIAYPPTFEAIAAVPFNINPHYIDPDPDSKHMGETRETRIKEFLVFNDFPVVGLREGSFFRVKKDEIKLGGSLNARIFEKGKDAYELSPEDDFGFLLK
jgi:dipeptidase E